MTVSLRPLLPLSIALLAIPFAAAASTGEPAATAPHSAPLLLSLVAILVAARFGGGLAQRFRQPAVVGELLFGTLLGASVLGVVDPEQGAIRFLAELGVILLLFEIGLETDLRKLLEVGPAALSVAFAGVLIPFGLGTAIGFAFALPLQVSLFVGGALTATSVGVTARVLAEMGRLADRESRIVLGAAVVDDVIGLVVLAVVSGLGRGAAPGAATIARIVGSSVGFVVAALLVGLLLAPPLVKLAGRGRVRHGALFLGLVFAFGFAALAELSGTATIIGAFAAGIVLARTTEAETFRTEIHGIAGFLVPVFFVTVGAAVDLRVFSPATASGRTALALGAVLLVAAIVGKLAAGWFVRDRSLDRLRIGVGMVPRGEVGLVFARVGLAAGILAPGIYGAIAFVVLGTTLVAPPWLRRRVDRAGTPQDAGNVAEISTDVPFDED